MGTTTSTISRSRQTQILDPTECQDNIAIMGAGTIGSHTALLLARMGFENITVYDFDTVEDHNIGHQMYRLKDVGVKKVDALKDLILEATGVEIKTSEDNGREGIETDILILGVDSMAARKAISESSTFHYLIDGRMGGETFNLFYINEYERDRYKKSLYSDEEAVELPCGGKSIGYISLMMASYIGILAKKIINAEEIPFEQNYCAKNLIYVKTP